MTSALAGTIEPVVPTTMLPYPIISSMAVGVLFTVILLVISGKFDQTQGVLTISIMIILGMLGATAYCLIFTIPQDDITPGIVGGLTAGFGAVVAHWLGRRDQGSNNADRDPPKPE
jgi:uncharacterized RDD family membrane protein YckC